MKLVDVNLAATARESSIQIAFFDGDLGCFSKVERMNPGAIAIGKR
jgi:hypothetical protein